MMIDRKVLIPLDRTDYSAKVVDQVIKLVPAANTKVFLLHVADPARSIGLGAANYETDVWRTDHLATQIRNQIPHPIYVDQVEASLTSDIERSMQGYARTLKNAGYEVSVVVEFGEPVAEILQFVEKEGVDLVAMTTHAREGLKRLLFGSVAEKVLHHINIPTLLLHPEERTLAVENLKAEDIAEKQES